VLIAGLTGGLACGKSFVAEALRRLGCHVVEADELGHAVLAPGGSAYAPVLREFGTVERVQLAKMVFGDSAALALLNGIVHPAVHDLARQRFREIAAEDPRAIAIYVAAILVETGGYRDLDKLIVADCSREIQIARALQRSGATPADIEARLNRQLPAERKRELADFIVNTEGTKEETLRQTKLVFEELRRLAS